MIDIPVTVLLAERFQNARIPRGIQLEPDIGRLSVQRNGRVQYNNRDISKQAYQLCGKNYKRNALPRERSSDVRKNLIGPVRD